MLAAIKTLLNQRLGLDDAAIGATAIEHAVRERIAACALPDATAYWQRLTTSEPEFQELIEAVVVPETWFFRDGEAFTELVRLAFQEWLPAHPDGPMRLLSLPCSSGEEAFSIAIALLDAGFPADRFHLDGMDVSRRALARAAAAVYGKNSFRSRDLAFRDRHFDPTPKGWHLREAVRRSVRFSPVNIMAAAHLPGVGVYDVIFCRNLLIYFDAAARERTIQALLRLLKIDGVFFVGPSETALLTPHPQLVSLKVPLAFAFRKTEPVARAATAAASPTPAPPRPAARRPAPAARPLPHPVPPPESEAKLDLAQQLADQGRLDEATRLGEDHLQAHGPSARVFHLLGLVRNAAGDEAQAIAYYRKALYLEPRHREALLHLALLLEKNGAVTEARLLGDRARRLQVMGVT